MFNHSFKPWSHIELNITNPNTIFKITVYCTKYTKHAQSLSNFWKISKIKKNQFLSCILYTFHNSYFVILAIYVYFHTLYTLYTSYIVEGHTAELLEHNTPPPTHPHYTTPPNHPTCVLYYITFVLTNTHAPSCRGTRGTSSW